MRGGQLRSGARCGLLGAQRGQLSFQSVHSPRWYVSGMPPFEPVTLALRDDDGNAENIVLPGPGGTIRVVVGEPGKQSGAWRIWAPANKSDVYIGLRAILGDEKWSLHESGDWRHQWVTDEKASEFGTTDSRIKDQWQQPDEVGATGWTRGFAIRVRHQDLVEVADPEKVPAGALWIPSRPAERQLSGARGDRPPGFGGEIALPASVPLGGFTLLTGGAALLLVSVEQVEDKHNQMIAAALTQGIRQARENGVDLAAAVAPRAALSGYNTQGERGVWDVAVRQAVGDEINEADTPGCSLRE